MKALWFSLACLAFPLLPSAPAIELGPPALVEKYHPAPAPAVNGMILQKGDRLAICGDSITEQRMYSRAMETYLTACVPQLGITVRQYGWGGETAPGFLSRMTNDCLGFKPTIATTCYGMNDHGYRAYEESIGQRYRVNQTAIVEAFKAAGARVVLGSPGCVGLRKDWDEAAVEIRNQNLCTLRNIDIEIARQSGVQFADVFWPMLTAGDAARQKYGADYAIAGKDGVHPGWAGSFVMAYAFLKAFGLDGQIGSFLVDLETQRTEASAGHRVTSWRDGELQLTSTRYPFCASGDVRSDATIRSAMSLLPFNRELNRLNLVVRNARASSYRVTWGAESHTYTPAQLAAGVNLAEDFVVNPFSEAFARVDAAVAAKQEYETRQIKVLFHGPEARRNLESVRRFSEDHRASLARALKRSMVPVSHTIRIVPVP